MHELFVGSLNAVGVVKQETAACLFIEFESRGWKYSYIQVFMWKSSWSDAFLKFIRNGVFTGEKIFASNIFDYLILHIC